VSRRVTMVSTSMIALGALPTPRACSHTCRLPIPSLPRCGLVSGEPGGNPGCPA
jgi:hypothetical protein